MLAFREFYESKHSLIAKWENYKDRQYTSEEMQLSIIREYVSLTITIEIKT